MSDADLMFRPAVELAAMVRSGEISARELVAVLARAHRGAQPAAQRVRGGRRRARAGDRRSEIGPGDERPFAGVPIAIKNNRAGAGPALTYGCALMADYVADLRPQRRRAGCKQAGFVIVGTTTLPEYGILPTTEARLFGPTRNPWDLQRTPGRLLGRRGGRRRGRHGAGRPRQRRRRLDPHPRGLLRPGGPEAQRGRISDGA